MILLSMIPEIIKQGFMLGGKTILWILRILNDLKGYLVKLFDILISLFGENAD